jgi:choloylglycine hydrolase
LFKWKIQNFGQGSGLLGLPGDPTSSSRFVRAVFYSQWAKTPKNAVEAVCTSFHILNTFDIFDGIIRAQEIEKDNISLPAKQTGFRSNANQGDMTEWIVVHDRTHLRTYFRTYPSLHIQMVDFKKIDFSKGGFRQITMEKNFLAEDLSDRVQPLEIKK